jgi:hypothetical protein
MGPSRVVVLPFVLALVATTAQSEPTPTPTNAQIDSVDRSDTPQPPPANENQKPSLERWGLYNNVTMTVLTLVMAVFTGLLWGISKRQTAMIHTIERAYVTMSHHAPGADFGYGFTLTSTEKPAPHREVTIRASVRNYGNTPATVTDVSLRHYVGADLPDVPEYLAGPLECAFLVKDNSFTVTREFSILEDRMTAMAKGEVQLWFYGYVDYIDQFGQRHRAGYARVYDRSLDDRGLYRPDAAHLDDAAYRGRNNLPFAMKPGYNYDRQRKKGEGKDWP